MRRGLPATVRLDFRRFVEAKTCLAHQRQHRFAKKLEIGREIKEGHLNTVTASLFEPQQLVDHMLRAADDLNIAAERAVLVAMRLPGECVAGPLMRELWQALPSERRGAYAETAAALEPNVVAAVRAGDAVMVKGSLGSRMGPLVKALERRYDRHAAGESASAQG